MDESKKIILKLYDALKSVYPVYQELYQSFDPEGEIAVHVQYEIVVDEALKEADTYLNIKDEEDLENLMIEAGIIN